MKPNEEDLKYYFNIFKDIHQFIPNYMFFKKFQQEEKTSINQALQEVYDDPESRLKQVVFIYLLSKSLKINN